MTLSGHGRVFPRVYRCTGTRSFITARRCESPAHPQGWDATVARVYGLMVMVNVPVAVLSCESCTCIGKVKVPAWVGVPVRTLLKPGAVVPRVRPGGSSLMLLTTNQEYGAVPPWAMRSWLYGLPTVPVASGAALICSAGSMVRVNCWVACWPA